MIHSHHAIFSKENPNYNEIEIELISAFTLSYCTCFISKNKGKYLSNSSHDYVIESSTLVLINREDSVIRSESSIMIVGKIVCFDLSIMDWVEGD